MGFCARLCSQTRQFSHRCSSKATWIGRRRLHASSQAKPLSDGEFRELYASCNVPQNVRGVLGVAFSGGPDSTALLFLLQRMLANENCQLHEKLFAIHIDHGLQKQSGEVAGHCASIAEALGIKYLAIKIPWGVHPFPSLAPGVAFEKIARDARYHIFMKVMHEHDISGIAFGHHCDDQVETAILRLSKGSSVIGLAGMRPLRRWGMGFGEDASSLGWAGYEGMRRWIVRPLLSVSKERLVATCEANGLNYAVDPTNFEPAITERNSIRHDLNMIDAGNAEGTRVLPTMKKLLDIGNTHYGSQSDGLQSLTLSNLRLAVSLVSRWVAEVDEKAKSALRASILPTVQSTILLSCESLSLVNDDTVRVAMVRRILRFVSPRPWGAPASEAGGRQTSLETIVTKIWGRSNLYGRDREPFVVGASVQWTPVAILPSGDVRFRRVLTGEKEGWIAHRQPPILKRKDTSSTATVHDPLNLNITDIFLDAFAKNTKTFALYDNRFAIQINPAKLPHNILELCQNSKEQQVEITIEPHSRYYLPRIVVRRRRTHPDDEQAFDGEPWEIGRLSLRGRVESPSRSNNKIVFTPVPSDAIRIDYVRVDDAFSCDIPKHLSYGRGQ
ncbi:hypothetical protein SCHPADRAFT_77541 [Schizopora paradoxa]|uniref:tRNA(Ile)-lysidine synthetase n=1 Tax=Schizopora paradoxa TaxID=27342 RepID=A0A0H2SBR6_9AGAM|nr:hypothetical protein SCHPADRAFT_77541 [Schizopora paradoxa]